VNESLQNALWVIVPKIFVGQRRLIGVSRIQCQADTDVQIILLENNHFAGYRVSE
jgi:hypothetical protein